MKKGMSTVHGSQHFQHPDGLLEVLRKHKHKGENRGHSIGYNQHSTDSNGLAVSETRCQNLKEQIIRSRPTSSSSNFMYVNPLIGVNQKYNNHMRFQPLDEDIPEEKERRKRNWKNTRKKLKKKKKKIIRCKPAEAGEGGSHRQHEESDNGENEEDNVQEDSNFKSKFTERQSRQYNNMKYDEADNTLSNNSDQTQEEPEEEDEKFLAPIYRDPSHNVASARKSQNSFYLKHRSIRIVNKSNPITPSKHRRLLGAPEIQMANSLKVDFSYDLLSIKSYKLERKCNQINKLSVHIKSEQQESVQKSNNSSFLRQSVSQHKSDVSEQMDYEKHLNIPELSQHSSSKTKDENEESEEESFEKMPGFSNKHVILNMQAELEKVKEIKVHKVKKRPLSCNFQIDIDAVTEQNYEDLRSATYRNMDQEQLVNNEEVYGTNNGDDIDEELIEEDDDQDEDSDDIDEEDEDECAESRPLTPDNKKPLDGISGSKKPILSNNKINGNYRGAFTCKIIKKKAQDIEKGKLVAFGTTAAIRNNDEMTNQQILERNKKIHKHYQGPYKKKKHISLFYSIPKNLEEQKKLFFESEHTYNPQFIYENEVLTRKYLKQFYNENNKSPEGVLLANDELLKSATKILKAWLKEYGSESNFLHTEGHVLTREETEPIIMDYLKELDIDKLLTLNFTENQVAPTSIVHDTKKKKARMNIRLPIEYRADRIMTVLHHEIGTHFIRRLNDKKQKWYGKKDKYDIRGCIQTEEGFAVLNQYCEHALNPKKKPYFYRAALNYYAACQAGVMSFVELYKDLEHYIDDPYRRWNFTLRVKRGITDTSVPGGLYKDQVYLEGALKILKDRKNINFYALIAGKLSLEDLYRPFLMKIIRLENIIIPPFMRDIKRYMKGLDRLAKINFID